MKFYHPLVFHFHAMFQRSKEPVQSVFNGAKSKKKSTAHMALGCGLAWLITWTPTTFWHLMDSHVTKKVVSTLQPLDGEQSCDYGHAKQKLW